jgi:hypothetical protein
VILNNINNSSPLGRLGGVNDKELLQNRLAEYPEKQGFFGYQHFWVGRWYGSLHRNHAFCLLRKKL